jgi:hypothetical protein
MNATVQQNTKSVSNTLTRWHKIADRVKQAASETKQKNMNTLQSSRSIDADTFSVRKGALESATAKAIGEQSVLYFSLLGTLFMIRRALAQANVKNGVSDLLSQMEEAKQTGEYYENMLETTEGTLTQDEFSALYQKKNAAAKNSSSSVSMYGVSVTFMSEAMVAGVAEKRDAARKLVNALADKLSDANATRITLDVDLSVATVIGL